MTSTTQANPNNNPERAMNESYEDYQERRKVMKKAEKRLRHGTEFHDVSYYGTYRNPTKRAMQAERKARREAKRA